MKSVETPKRQLWRDDTDPRLNAEYDAILPFGDNYRFHFLLYLYSAFRKLSLYILLPFATFCCVFLLSNDLLGTLFALVVLTIWVLSAIVIYVRIRKELER